MAAACVRAGRPTDAATLVAITKTWPVERLRLIQAAGYDVLGENRDFMQELARQRTAAGDQARTEGETEAKQAVAVPIESGETVQAAERSSSAKEEDLDIPAFLRRSR